MSYLSIEDIRLYSLIGLTVSIAATLYWVWRHHSRYPIWSLLVSVIFAVLVVLTDGGVADRGLGLTCLLWLSPSILVAILLMRDHRSRGKNKHL